MEEFITRNKLTNLVNLFLDFFLYSSYNKYNNIENSGAIMEILFKTKKLQKEFNDERILLRVYGELASKIKLRMSVLRNANNLNDVPSKPPDRCHELTANRSGQFAVDLSGNYRLVFKPTENPPPKQDDGGISREKVISITIIEVVNYHE